MPLLAPTDEVIWRPNVGPQTAFLASTADEVLYGGAAGGGKSGGLRGCPLRWIDNPNYRGLYLRREAKYLADAVDKSRALYTKLGAVLVQSPRIIWTFPSGAELWMNHCEHESDVSNYDSFEFSEILWDELTHFTLKQYVGINARLRGTDPTLPYWSRAATNPGGVGHAWVFKRWAAWLDPAHPKFKETKPGQKRWYRDDDEQREREGDGEVRRGTPLAQSRTFIPARLEDNPHVAPGYRAHILALDPVRRRQLDKGDWLVKPAAGLYFQRTWIKEWVDAPPAKVTRRVRYWDLAAGGDFASGTKYSRAKPWWYVEHVARIRGTPGKVRELVFTTMSADGRGVEVWIERDPGQAGKDQAYSYTTDERAQGYNIRFRPKRVDKITAGGPFSAQAEAGHVAVVRGLWVDAWCDELEGFPEGDYDDQWDSTTGAHTVMTEGNSEAFAGAMDKLKAGK